MPMIKLEELWIGDKVQVASSGQRGSYEGSIGGKAKIKIGAKILLVAPEDLQVPDEIESETPLIFEDSTSPPLEFHKIPTTLDLHIEKLDPSRANEHATVLLNYQMRILKEYIQTAEEAGLKYLTIIHGKGAGVLKKEVQHYLKGRAKTKFLLDKNDGGATEVHLY